MTITTQEMSNLIREGMTGDGFHEYLLEGVEAQIKDMEECLKKESCKETLALNLLKLQVLENRRFFMHFMMGKIRFKQCLSKLHDTSDIDIDELMGE